MRFPARDLKPYAEPVLEASLIEGAVYFAVQFHDEAMLVPEVEALVYLGRREESGSPVRLEFQDAGSFLARLHGSDQGMRPVRVYSQPSGQCKHIFEFDRALDVLLACSFRRAEHEGKGPGRAI